MAPGPADVPAVSAPDAARPAATGRARSPRPLLLYFGILPFTAVRQRPQQLALALTRDFDVVYVDPPYSLAGARRRKSLRTAPQIEALPAGLHLIAARTVLPFSGYAPGINALNSRLETARVRAELRRRALPAPQAILTSFPKQLHLLAGWPGVPVCYDIMDDYPLFFDRWQRRLLQRWHAALVRRADLVVVSSRTLGERYGAAARRLACITNGVTAEFVAGCTAAAPAPEILAYPGPRFGCVGALAPWFDFAAVAALADANPHASVLLVGPVMTAIPPLPANVHVLGPRPHATLPPILRAFDVGLIPLLRLPMIECANQVKLYEYLAAALPVVATDFREMQPFAAWVEACAVPADWPAAAARALAAPRTADWLARRRAVAAQNLWSDKAAALATELLAALGAPR